MVNRRPVTTRLLLKTVRFLEHLKNYNRPEGNLSKPPSGLGISRCYNTSMPCSFKSCSRRFLSKAYFILPFGHVFVMLPGTLSPYAFNRNIIILEPLLSTIFDDFKQSWYSSKNCCPPVAKSPSRPKSSCSWYRYSRIRRIVHEQQCCKALYVSVMGLFRIQCHACPRDSQFKHAETVEGHPASR